MTPEDEPPGQKVSNVLLGKNGGKLLIALEGMKTESKQKQGPIVDVSGGESKVQCCKKQYCIGTWNIRSMNQGKWDVVTQEMAK